MAWLLYQRGRLWWSPFRSYQLIDNGVIQQIYEGSDSTTSSFCEYFFILESVDRPFLDKLAVYHDLGVYRHMYTYMNLVNLIIIYLFRSHIDLFSPIVEIIPGERSIGNWSRISLRSAVIRLPCRILVNSTVLRYFNLPLWTSIMDKPINRNNHFFRCRWNLTESFVQS